MRRDDVMTVSVNIENGFTDSDTTYRKVWLVGDNDSFDEMVRNIGCYVKLECSLLMGKEGYIDPEDNLTTYEDYEDNYNKMTSLDLINMKLEKQYE